MQITAINASHRGDRGTTHFLLQTLLRGASEAGAVCKMVVLARLKLNRCLACLRCQSDEAHLRCVYEDKDDMAAVLAQMAAADVIVFATPVYMMTMSGLMKTLLDRLYSTMDVSDMHLNASGLIHHHVNPAIVSKPFVLLTCCSNVEAETPRSVVSYFHTYSRFMDAPQVGTLVRNATPLLEHARSHNQMGAHPRVARVLAAYEQAGRELAASGRIHRSTQRAANQEIVPVPFFSLLKRLRPVRLRVIDGTQRMLQQNVS